MKKEILVIGILVLFALTGTAFAKTVHSEANDLIHSGTGSWMMCREPLSVEEPANMDSANVTMGIVSMNDRDEISYASGKTWYVDDDGGPGIDFTKIQDAVNAASAGDTIIVKNGTYNEQVKLDKQLTIEGENRPLINAAGKPLYGILIDHTSGCVIRGFEVKPSTEVEVGIYLYYSHSNQIIDNIASNHRYGIAVVYSNDNIVNANVVYDNLGGIGVWYSTGTNISDNIAYDNYGSGGEDSGNIGINWANNNVIRHSLIF
jgi:parallel beta-helix repeat protein